MKEPSNALLGIFSALWMKAFIDVVGKPVSIPTKIFEENGKMLFAIEVV